MKVIGVGFGRTGTMSLKKALDVLGFGNTMHNSEFLAGDASLQAVWNEKINGFPIPWEMVFRGYNSTVDWPGVYYWKELADHFPEAKIILTLRPAREWLESFKLTVGKNIESQVRSPRTQRFASRIIIGGRTFRDDFSDQNLLRVYARHVVDVKSRIGEDRLLCFNVNEGWQPLCRFLKVPIPETPFPLSNSTAEFEAMRVALTA